MEEKKVTQRVRAKKMQGINNAYNHYKEITPKDQLVSRVVFKDICFDFMKFLSEKILECGEVYVKGFGNFYIGATKSKKIRLLKRKNRLNFPIDWVESKKQKKIVYNTNEITDGVIYKFIWSRGTSSFKNKTVLQFVYCRATKRALAKIIKNNELKFKPMVEYIE